MLLYHFHDMQYAALAPLRLAAEATQAAFQNPFVPASYTGMGRVLAAGAEIIERSTRTYTKPAFNIGTVKSRGHILKVEEEIVLSKPFCRLLHFKRSVDDPGMASRIAQNPRVLIVAPLAGQHATLLRGTVETMLQDHDVTITDWIDAKMVPFSKGPFDLEEYIAYLMDFIRLLGPDIHVVAVCQPAVPVMCAVALLAEGNDPAQPRSMTLMGGPIEPRAAKTLLTEFAETHSLDWFRNMIITAIPFYYPGAYRLVYPGFLQLQGFMSMHMDRHVGEQFKMFQHLVRGDEEAASANRKFYDEYLSVMDVTAEYYLQTVERVFHNCDLPNGTFSWRGHKVKPEAIQRTALLTVEGEMDDISAPGQTRAALDLCPNLPTSMKQAYLQIGVGHFGVFNGRKWRQYVQPVVREFIRANDRSAG
ncbi:MAG: polyhydroxyalkanoate depolymerase [Alphaproteobacteria bacterium]|nr:polyhydroxyalkanoate depolymerase [Alphaproteobacteria bacterium]